MIKMPSTGWSSSRTIGYCFLLLLVGLILQLNIYATDGDSGQYNDLNINKLVVSGRRCLFENKSDSAMLLFTQAFSRYSEHLSDSDKYYCAQAYNLAGNVCYGQFNYSMALKFYLNSLQISEKCKYKELIPRIFNNIGSVYGVYEDFESSINFFEYGIYNLKYTQDVNTKFNLYINLSGTYSYLGIYDRAKEYYDLAVQVKPEGNKAYDYLCNAHYGLLLIEKKEYDRAIVYLKKAISVAEQNSLPAEYVCSVYFQLSNVYKNIHQEDSLFYYARKCRQIAEEKNLPNIRVQTYEQLYNYYENNGNDKLAMMFKSKYLDLTDSIFNQRNYFNIKNMHILYEAKKLQERILALDMEQLHKEKVISLQRKVIFTVCISLLAIVVLLFWILRQKRQLQMSYRNLFNINEETIASEKRFRNQLYEYERLLKKENASVFCNGEEDSGHPDGGQPDNEQPENRQTSKIGEELEYKILSSIRHVMEDTEDFCSDDFSLDKLAKSIKSNSKYVSQVINEHYGKNFSSFVNDYRIRKACERLTDKGEYSNYTIQAIAESVGYKSHSTFIKIFRKITGIAPSIYRNMSKTQEVVVVDS